MANSIVSSYAEKFCQENPIKTQKREQWGYVSSKVKVHNGECIFGPGQAWPAQRDGLFFYVAERHSAKSTSYDVLSEILKLDVPELTTRTYESKWEYQRTVEALFETAMQGMRFGRIEQCLRKKAEQVKLPWYVFKNKNQRRLELALEKNPVLARIIETHDSEVPKFYGIKKNLGFIFD